jgi:spore coat protein A
MPGYIEAGGREIPLVVQDKIFKNGAGPNAAKFRQYETPVGDLWYPYMYETNRWKANGTSNLPQPSCIPEFFGDTMLMNGTVYPTVTVEPRRYRIRFLNACNARFLNLQLFIQDASADGITLSAAGIPTNPVGPPMTIIGAEGGFLPAPVTVNTGPATAMAFNPVTMSGNIIVAPAERLDMLIDFSALAPGTKLIMYNDAPAPFPVGSPLNDYYPGAPKNPVVTTPGFGPNTRQLMEFVVGSAVSPPDPPLNLAGLKMDPAPLVPPGAGVIGGVTQLPPGTPVRRLTLNEVFDANGRLIQTMGTNVPLVKGTFGRAYTDPPTETIAAGATEVWQIANLTGDTHPIHFHLVNLQIISRQPFKAGTYNGVPSYTGPARPPEPIEMGWKETVRMNPGEVTTVIAKFDLPAVPFTVPVSPRTGGNEYVYHCHILEHEEHDMMRPLVVL